MVEGEGEPLRFELGDDYQEAGSFHHWFAMRGTSAARAAVAFTASPDWLRDPEKLALVAIGDNAALAAAVAARKTRNASSRRENKAESLLDLCAGIGTIGAMAARLGFGALALELSIVPHLIGQVLYDFPVSMAAADNRGTGDSWRGYVTEVADFADAVWRGAKERLKELFEEDVDIRVWVRVTECPFCGTSVPLVSNARLSAKAALNIIPDPSPANDSRIPRFGLLRTEFPDLRGTFAKGFCTCPSCRNRFRFQRHDLIFLRSVPVAIRRRDSDMLSEIDSPGIYVQQVEAASYDSLAASSQRLDDRVILAGSQPIFYDIRGEPIRVRDMFLPRQRAYFGALAESMNAESALLAKRTVLTDAQRTAVRIAVALLISGQADFVNTCIHSSIDKHPSTWAGPLRLGGQFTEVGGFWLERFWQNRLHQLLGLLKVNSSAALPVRAIKASADAIPLGDAAVSAVIWDPPYYDNIDYDTVAGHYQSVLAAVVPDITGEPALQPRLPRAERTKRYEDDLLQQAREARRVVSPDGSIGVFWLARKPAELKHFLELIGPAALQLVHAVRLDTIRPPRAASAADQQTYLLILQPIPVAAPEVAVDAEKVLSLAAEGALSLYDGLADLLESVLEPEELDELIADERSGSSRQRLARYLFSQPELEQLLIELGRPSLLRELVHRGARRDDLRAVDIRGLAQRLLDQLGFAVARPVRFSIREALRDCDNAARRLELADSAAAVREAFLAGFNRIEGILRYTVFAWAYLECGDQWTAVFEQVVRSSMPSYAGPERLSFGHLHVLFTKLPATFASSDQAAGKDLFANIARALKKAKINEKLGNLVYWRNGVGHEKEYVTSLSVPQLRERCSAVLTDTCAALAEINSQRVLPVTVRPEVERRYRNQRVLSLLDPDDVTIEVYVDGETDLTEPLIYFASGNNGRRDINPKFLRAAVVEFLSGLTGQDSKPVRA